MSQERKEVIVICDEDANIPLYASTFASGADVYAHLDENLMILPGDSALISTGLFFEIPEGFEIQVRPRSGLAFKNKITVLNTPGTIDSDYRGELKIILINHGKQDFIVEPKMRIAQIVLARVIRAEFIVAEKLSTSGRGSGGFGHTGRY
jgi:dUTP pyrophosphatase